MEKSNENIEPCVDTVYRVVKQFGRLMPNETFYIKTFGGIKGSRVWWCQTLYDNGRQFPVLKTTLKKSVDNGTIKDLGFIKNKQK